MRQSGQLFDRSADGAAFTDAVRWLATRTKRPKTAFRENRHGFNDPGIDPLNKTLFTFASDNARPNRIVRLRKRAGEDGLGRNKWFGDVEREVAKDVGPETVNYVSNIYKYYIA